ncbi:phage tail protein [Streptomyces sp. CAS3]
MTEQLPLDTLALPAVFATDTVMQEFAAAVAELLKPYGKALDELPNLLDSWLTDPEWLDWLSWASGAPGSASWPDAARRAAIESAAMLAAARGTRQALEREAGLLGWELSIADPGGVVKGEAPAGQRRPLVVSLAWPPTDEPGLAIARSRLTRMVERHCPAHVPWRVLVADGFSPTAGLGLPEDQRAVFFYRPAPGGDQAVEYSFTARTPIAPSDLEQQIVKELALLGAPGVDAAAWHELGFLITSGNTVYLWDKKKYGTTGGFTVKRDLEKMFPPPVMAASQQPQSVNDILAIRSGDKPGYYVFRGECCDRYPFDRVGQAYTAGQAGERRLISELYTNLPLPFQRDLDAAIEDPLRPGIHYLLSGPHCAEIEIQGEGENERFMYCRDHLIRDLWPGLPVWPSTVGVGGGMISLLSDMHTCGNPLQVSYSARRSIVGAQLQIYPAPPVPYENRYSLPTPGPHRVEEATLQRGSVTFGEQAVDSPGVYTVYYVLPAFKTWLADPVSFTAVLENPNGVLKLEPDPGDTSHVMRKAVAFSFDSEHVQGAAIKVYAASAEPVPQKPHALETVRTIQISQTRGKSTVSGGAPYPPGDYTAYLVARGGFAWLAQPLPFTAILLDEERGTLVIGNPGQDEQGCLPGGPVSFPIAYKPNPLTTDAVWAQGTVKIYRQDEEPADAPPNTLPDGSPLATQEADLRIQPTAVNNLLPGGYSAYFCAPGDSTAWLTERKRFTVSAPTLGELTVTDPGKAGTPVVLDYGTDYPDPANKIAVFEFTEGEDHREPVLNTDSTTWPGLTCAKTVAGREGTVSLTAEDLAPEGQVAAPGDYRVFFVSSGGGNLADPVMVCSTLKPDEQYGQITLVSPNLDAITTATAINLDLATSYPHAKNQVRVCPGAAPEPLPDTAVITKALSSGPVTIEEQKLMPGKYTVYFTARNSLALLAPPFTFLVNAAITEDDYIEPDIETGLQGISPVTITYSTRFSQESGYDDSDNRILVTLSSKTSSFEQREYSATGPSGSVEINDLPIGDYKVQFIGKDDSQLAEPTAFSVTPRTVELTLQDATYDTWKAPAQATTTGCTATKPSDIPAASPGNSGQPVSVIFTQTSDTVFPTRPAGTAAAMKGDLPYTHAEHSDPVTLFWTMQQDGMVTYRAQAPNGCRALLSTSPPENKTQLPDTDGVADQPPAVSIALHNDNHRTTSVTLHNTLSAPLALEGTPQQPVNAAFNPAPEATITAGTQGAWASTVIVTGSESSGAVSYTCTPAAETEVKLGLAWTSPPAGQKPTYTVTLPASAKVVTDDTVWDRDDSSA